MAKNHQSSRNNWIGTGLGKGSIALLPSWLNSLSCAKAAKAAAYPKIAAITGSQVSALNPGLEPNSSVTRTKGQWQGRTCSPGNHSGVHLSRVPATNATDSGRELPLALILTLCTSLQSSSGHGGDIPTLPVV